VRAEQPAQVIATLASADSEAEARFDEWRHVDPLPDIAPALLNSADVLEYVVATGMVHPFHPKKLKPASYSIPLLGKAIFWDWETGKRRSVDVSAEEEFELQPNSIAFVTLEPTLRVPDYIALRFNLRVTNVYRGLLLGTGPLVDPGFTGRLSIPLHNLTTNPYWFRGGEDLISMEFTKLSTAVNWTTSRRRSREGATYVPYRRSGEQRDVADYLQEAVGQQQVVSSISDALKRAKHAARLAEAYSIGGAIAAAAVIASLIAIIVNVYMFRGDVPRRSDLERQQATLQQQEQSLADLQAQINRLRKRKASP
jgi:deoxycytidine triphosphate deaminase